MNANGKKLKVYKASAGSGKTFRLAVEYIALLVKEPTEYQHVLAVTFTNKATGEMKQRILSQLYGIANGLESSEGYVDEIIKLLAEEGIECERTEVRRKCEKALGMIVHDYSNFRIVTIDSFFQSIVRELANELGLSSNISAELDADSVIEKAVDDIIDNLSMNSPEYDSLVRYIESQIDEEKNWKIDKAVAEFGKNVVSEKFLIHDNSEREKITDKKRLDEYRKKLFEYKKGMVDNLNGQMQVIAECALKAVDDENMRNEINGKTIKFFDSNWEKKDGVTDAQQKYGEDASKWTKNTKREEEQARLIDEVLMPSARKIVELLKQRLKIENDVNASASNLYNLMIIGKIDEQIDRLNYENNRFLLAETAHFLRDVINESNLPFIYEKTGNVINHIMIDEFQDTSALQWMNFKPLLLNCLDAGQSCLIVGDVKQSIYRFRNSDWKVLNEIDKKESEMHRYIEPIHHFVNHRSSPTVIDFNNKFFHHLIKTAQASYSEKHGTVCEELNTAYENMSQKSQDAEHVYGYVRVENIVAENGDKAEKTDYVALEHERIFKAVKDLIDSNVDQNDIAILVRKGYEATEICKYFDLRKDELNVKLISNEAFKLDASSAVNMIIFALRSISAQQDRLHLATLAFYYQTLVKKSQEVLSNISLPILASNDELTNKYLPREFTKQRSELRYKSIAEIVEAVYDMFELHKLEKQDAYMFCFHDIVEEYTSENLADIDSFLQKWDEELHEKSIPNGNSTGIRVMTIHKSKGLEFHTVIMPHCNGSMLPKDSGTIWCMPSIAPYNEMPLLPIKYSSTKNSDAFAEDHDKEELMTLVDNINVMYVGFTRAKHNLIIITDENSKDANSANRYIVESLENAKIDDSTHRLDMNVEMEDGVTTYTIGEVVGHSGPNIPMKEKKKDVKENPLNRHYDDTIVKFVSNKTMAEFRQSNESDLFISEKSENEKVQKHAEKMRMISIGNMYHNTLQLVSTPADIHSAVMQMEKRGCFETCEKRMEFESDIERLVDSVSKNHPEWFARDWKTINERAILFADAKDGSLCTKRPDRVIVKGNRAIVIDYKTSADAAHCLPSGEWVIPKENVQQVEQYCNLLQEIGYESVEGYLWYILKDLIYEVK